QQVMTSFDSPGNIRQMENFCQWLTVMSSSQVIEAKDLPPEVFGTIQSDDSHAAAGEYGNVDPTGGTSHREALPVATNHPDGTVRPEASWASLLGREVHARLARNEPAIMSSFTRDFERVLIE